jgi:hypothetical protein
MITLTWLELANPLFQQAVGAIWDCPSLDGHTSYSAHRIRQGIEKVEKDVKDLRLALCKKHGKKDADGKLINDERGWIQFETPEIGKQFEEEFTKEFSERSLEMKVTKLNFEKLVQVRGITPRMWEFLQPVVENLPAESEAPVEPA